jgi:hypothetical protein
MSWSKDTRRLQVDLRKYMCYTVVLVDIVLC